MKKSEILDKIKAFKKTSQIVCLSTLNLEKFPETRAMLNINNTEAFPHLKGAIKENDPAVYFTTNTSSPKIKQIAKNRKASVYFSDNLNFEGLLLIGAVKEIKEAKTKELFWTDGWKIYYPKGKDGGDYSILKFVPESYKFYCGFKVIKGKIKTSKR